MVVIPVNAGIWTGAKAACCEKTTRKVGWFLTIVGGKLRFSVKSEGVLTGNGAVLGGAILGGAVFVPHVAEKQRCRLFRHGR